MHIIKEMNSEYLKSILSYDRGSGEFLWKINRSSVKSGDVAGYISKEGYRAIGIDKRKHYLHRLAWLYMHGELPSKQIDHINGVRHDNRECNLRGCTSEQNNRNVRRVKKSDATSGFIGVGFHKKSQKWVARIRDGEKQIHIGLFVSEISAAHEYDKMARKLHGSFATVNFV